jgi:hypothetical protein
LNIRTNRCQWLIWRQRPTIAARTTGQTRKLFSIPKSEDHALISIDVKIASVLHFSKALFYWRNTMSDLQFASWKEVFLKAMDEKDRNKATQLLHQADEAIFRRQQELDDSPLHREELSAIAVAIEALRVSQHALRRLDTQSND